MSAPLATRIRWWAEASPVINRARALLLRIALGDGSYDYMIRTLAVDRRVKTARMVDVVVRKDGIEKRFEADWIKHVARICWRDVERLNR